MNTFLHSVFLSLLDLHNLNKMGLERQLSSWENSMFGGKPHLCSSTESDALFLLMGHKIIQAGKHIHKSKILIECNLIGNFPVNVSLNTNVSEQKIPHQQAPLFLQENEIAHQQLIHVSEIFIYTFESFAMRWAQFHFHCFAFKVFFWLPKCPAIHIISLVIGSDFIENMLLASPRPSASACTLGMC